MIIKKPYIESLTAIFITTVLIISTMFLSACGATKKLETGSTWEVSETTKLSRLEIAEGAVIKAPDNQNITMTIDHIETEICPGTYKGDIVLTLTEQTQDPIMWGGGTDGESGDDSGGVRTAIYVDKGVYVPEKSVPAALAGGKVANNSAENISIKSAGKKFTGVIVTGDSVYSINNPDINFNGGDQGMNGAGITTAGTAEVTVNDAMIVSKGVQRAAIIVGGNSTIHVNNSYIETHDGILPEQFANMEDSNSMEVPWVMGFVGNNRATNVVESGTAYYNNTHIKTQRWGCLSTDMAQEVKLFAANCRLETIESGYGAYADKNCTAVFDGCHFDVHDYGFIMSGGSGTFTNGTVVNSGRFGAMLHGSGAVLLHGAGTLTIKDGCVFNTKEAVIQVKSACPTITVDNAELNSENGIILEAIVSDDPWKFSGEMPGGGPDSIMTEGGSAAGSGLRATFRNVMLKGDIVSAMTGESDMIITFEDAAITGAITTATSESKAEIEGVELRKKTYYYIGAVKNTYCATDEMYGVKVSLDEKSRWIVDKNSFLTDLIISEGAVVAAPEGYRLTITVDGVEKEIKAGEYAGNIALIVTKP